MAKNTVDEIKQALTDAGIDMSDSDIQQLANGNPVQVIATTKSLASGLCQGIKIHDFGNGCGLYYIPPLTLSYCCEI